MNGKYMAARNHPHEKPDYTFHTKPLDLQQKRNSMQGFRSENFIVKPCHPQVHHICSLYNMLNCWLTGIVFTQFNGKKQAILQCYNIPRWNFCTIDGNESTDAGGRCRAVPDGNRWGTTLTATAWAFAPMDGNVNPYAKRYYK